MKKLSSSLSYVILAVISFISLFPFYMMAHNVNVQNGTDIPKHAVSAI